MKYHKRRRRISDDDISQRYREKQIAKKRHSEMRGGFVCMHCRIWVVINPFIGTANRNHCNICLWSRHVDTKKGDRMADCQAGMRPIGLTFRIEDRFGSRGELMLVHQCAACGKVSINRIARDDTEWKIMEVFAESLIAGTRLDGIGILTSEDEHEVRKAMYGD